MRNKDDVIEIDLLKIFYALWHRLWFIILMAIIGGGAMFAYSSFAIEPKYKTSVMLYVNNTREDSISQTINNSDLTAAQSLTDTYIIILKSWPVLQDVGKTAGVTYDYSKLNGMISADAVNDTEVFSVTVESTDPEEAQRIANAVTEVLPDKIADIVTGSSVEIVSEAMLPTQKSSPNIKKYTVIGVLAGIAISCMLIIIQMLMDTLMDTKIHDEDYLTETYNLPVLTVVPDLIEGSEKYRSKKHAKTQETMSRKNSTGKHLVVIGLKPEEISKRQKTFGENLSFSASEAYKLLRTNLAFTLADEENCKIIGITSATVGEGKSTTSINLAYTLAQNDKKVLLLEADMRIPVIASVLKIEVDTGLSQVLAGLSELNKALYKSPMASTMMIMPAGDVPPNPAELLSSRRMEQMMQTLVNMFDYIVIDLPPVNVVSDALTISKLLTGMLTVVRQEYCERDSLAEAMRRLEMMQVKVLGFVMTDAKTGEKKYGYGYRYGYGYGQKPGQQSFQGKNHLNE